MFDSISYFFTPFRQSLYAALDADANEIADGGAAQLAPSTVDCRLLLR